MSKNMNYNFDMLTKRVLDSLNSTDLEHIKKTLQEIKDPTIITGVGGSKVVSDYLKQILERKNQIITTSLEPRDIPYHPLSNYKNIISCSYGGHNHGVNTSFDNDLTHYLFSSKERDDSINLTYQTTLPQEESFISLAATLIPMAISLFYYTGTTSIIEEILSSPESYPNLSNNLIEIFTGYETHTPSTFLESTLTESGIKIPIVHDKYSYCHGRSTLSKENLSSVIYFNQDTELDNLLLEELSKYQSEIITLSKKYDDPIINSFYLTFQSMLLAKVLAEHQQKDLSKVDYSPIVKTLYYYKGEM